MQPIDLDDLNSEKRYLGQQAYKDSKLANVMFTLELARRLQGTGVTVNCLCPGFIPNTEFLRNNGTFIRGFCRYIIGGLMRPFLKITRTVEEGGQAIVQLAVDEKLAGQTGKFFRDFVEDKVSVEATKEQDQQRLWQISEKMVGLESYQGMD
ncbi:retinol dehydrogenase 14-like [Lingula anatina]|uniref:Retinol dehydrogenase 14-like n=1 Tax=Lingula anatina TaxID=7574 RepID=A0A2R2MMT2_LINAN|nr:retinol dehydrogenase 14-like [Lingula anatina]|eukprot:XP_023931510.1 retinol dehydrogenase 14-like [Lingula anatina]